MSDKFAITAELQLRTSQQFDSQIDKIRASIKPITLTLDKTKFNEGLRSVRTSIKQLSEKTAKLPVSLDTGSFSKDIKNIYNQFKSIDKLISNNKLKISFDHKAFDRDTNVILINLRTIRGKAETPLNITINRPKFDLETNAVLTNLRTIRGAFAKKALELNIDFVKFDAQVIGVLNNLKTIRGAFSQQPLNLSINNKINTDISNLVSLINSVTSSANIVNFNANTSPSFDQAINDLNNILGAGKQISFSLVAKVSKKSASNIATITQAINDLNLATKSFDPNNLALISTSIGSLSQNLGTLAKLSGKNFKFSFGLKDVKFFDNFVTRIDNLALAFDKVTNSSTSFALSIRAIHSAYQQLFTLLSSNKNPYPKPPKGGTAPTPGGAPGQSPLSNTITGASDAIEDLGLQTAQTFKKFGAYTIATAGIFKLTYAIRDGINEFIEFDKELNKVQQVTGLSAKSTNVLAKEVSRLAITYGVSSNSILNTSLVLAQAGFTAKETQQALEALTQTELAATFDDINDTVEATVALMSQFEYKAEDLQEVLSSINSVSAKFAVESKDITVAIQKTGGAFAAAGGSLEELMALFTSVRSTTRESADTIATGFRTIFTRLQRVRTQEFLRDFGINLNYSAEEARAFGKTAGEFVGPYKAIERLGAALSKISKTDPRFAQITEELGGFRQISKVIPLITQTDKAQQAYTIATTSQNSLFRDAAIAQETYANKLTKVREEFLALIREFGNDKEIKELVGAFLDLSKNLISVLKYTKDLLPLLSTLGSIAAFPIGLKFFGSLGQGLTKRINRAEGGPVKFARGGSPGGFIPGWGTKDDVPALLMKGEYVFNNEAVKAIGVKTLDDINFKRFPKKKALGGRIGYANGGRVGYANGGKVGGLASSGNLVIGLAGLTIADSYFKTLNNETRDLIGAVVSAAVQFKLLNLLIASNGQQLKYMSNSFNNAGKSIKEFRDASRTSRLSRKSISDIQQQFPVSSNANTLTVLQNRLQTKRNSRANARNDYQQNLANIAASNDPVYRQAEAVNARNNLSKFRRANKSVQATKQKISFTQSIQDQLNYENEILNESEAKKANARSKFSKIRGRSEFLQKSLPIAAGTAIVGGVAGQFLQDRGNKQLDKFRESGGSSKSAGSNIIAGGTISSALQFGAGGAAFGSIFGPIGTAVGGAAGLIIGGAKGFYDSSEEFRTAVESINVDKIGKNLSNSLGQLSSGKTSSGAIRGSVVSDLNLLQNKLQSESDPGVRSDIKAALDNSSVELRGFVNDLARTSNTIQEFNQKIDVGTRKFIASILNINFKDFQEQIKETIRVNAESIEAAKKLAQANKALLSETQAVLNLTEAFVFAESEIKTFSKTIDSFINGGNGPGAKSSFSNIDAEKVPNSLIPKVSQFTDQFGIAGKTIGEFATNALKAKELLPDILLELKNQGAFGNESDLTNTLSQRLNAAGISGAIAKSIESKLPGVLGGEFKDSEFFKKLDEDFPNVIKQLTEGFGSVFSSIKESAERSADALNTFSDGLSEVRKTAIQNIANSASSLDTNDQITKSRDSFFGRRTSSQALFSNQFKKDNILTGGQNVSQLAGSARGARANILSLNDQLSNTQDVQARKALIESIDKQKFILDRANQGLSTLADRSEKLSIIQEALANAQGDRLKVKDFLTTAVFGDKSAKLQQARIGLAGQTVANTGNINFIPDDLKGEILNYFKSFGDTKIIGTDVTGNQAIDKVLKNAGVDASIIGPNKTETNLQTKLEEEIKNGAAAREALNQILIEDRQNFSKQLNTDFDTFLSNLNTSLNQRQATDIGRQIQDTQGSLNKQKRDATILSKVNSISPNIPANIDDIVSINKKFNEIGTLPNVLDDKILRLSNSITDNKNSLGLFDKRTINQQGFEQLKADVFKNIPETLADQIDAKLRTSDVGFDSKTNTRDLGKVFEVMKAEFESAKTNSVNELSDLSFRRSKIIKNVGGSRNYGLISQNAESIQKELQSVENKNFEQLTTSIQSLTAKLTDLQAQKKALGFNSGGHVPGSGNFDSVPARLTPGEYVMTKNAVNKYGPKMMSSINRGTFPKGYAEGGAVTEGYNYIDAGSINRFSYAVNVLSTQVDRLEYIFKSIPTQINLNGSHTVEVVLSGAQVLTSIMPEIGKLIENATRAGINKMLRQKFPNSGTFDG